MAAGTENDRNAALVQEIIRPQHVVAGLHLMVDVLDAGLWRPHQRDGVMDRIDAHQGNIADPVADARVADLGPKPLVAGGIGRIEADMAEAGNSCIA